MDSGSALRLKDVIFVSVLKKNLISIVVLEDCGYDMIFRKGKALFRHISMGKVKQIRFGEEPIQSRGGGFCCIEHKSREGVKPQCQ